MFPELTFFSVMGGHPCQRIRRLGNRPRTMTIGFTGFCRTSQRRYPAARDCRKHGLEGATQKDEGRQEPPLACAGFRPAKCASMHSFSVEQREGRRDRGAVVESLEHVGPIHAPRCGAFLSLN